MKRYIVYLFTLALAAGGCTKNFDELRKNPNNVEDATPGSFLAPILYNTIVTDITRAHRMGNDLVQYTVHKGDGIEFHRYYFVPTEADYFWDREYNTLFNIRDMYNRAITYNDKNFQAVALTLKGWVGSKITDIFGDIPYSQALLGDSLLLPKYDEQKDVYASILQGLDSAALLFGNSGTLAYGSDILYAGDVVKWKKFCNSLRLRLYLRVSKRPEMNSAAKISEIVNDPGKYPIFTSVADEACLNFTGIDPFYNPFYNARDLDFNLSKAPSTYVISLLEERTDPRIATWYTKSNGDYVGVLSGYPRSQNGAVFATPTSNLQANLDTTRKLGTILSYAEVQFILAEAKLKGWISTATTAQTYYENGIKASMDHWGVTMPSGYLTQPTVLFDNLLSTIMTQKYLAQWFVGLESWYEFRRTGLPALPVNPQALNEGKMPVRLYYPTSTQLLNNASYKEVTNRIGGDNPNIKCWWEK